MIRSFIAAGCVVFAVSASFGSSTAFAEKIMADKSLSIMARPAAPVTVELSSLAVKKENVLEMRPYSGDFSGVRNEVMIYRIMYLTVAVIIMTALSLAAKKT